MNRLESDIERSIQRFEPNDHIWLKSIFHALDDVLSPAFEAGMLYNMPSFYVALKDYPQGYHAQPGTPLPFLSFTKQKHYLSIYFYPLMSEAVNLSEVESSYLDLTGRRLKHGKSCLLFSKPEHLPLSWLCELVKKISIREWIEMYEVSLQTRGRKSRKI